jgi:hypothetical protein
MAHPILLLGLAVGAGLAWAKRGSSAPVPATTDAALIDPAEKTHPNAETARLAIVNSMTVNSVSLYEMTARAIETQLKMPKTAANLRTWSTMAQQGGHTIAGDDGDEVGARRRRRHRRRSRRAAAASMAMVQAAAASSPVLAPLVRYGSSSPSDTIDTDEGGDDEGGDEDEVGAAARPRRLSSGAKRLPDWLRFNATQAVLVGDPSLIRATAHLMRRMGYVKHAEIHLRALNGARSI